MSEIKTIDIQDVRFEKAYYTRTESQSPAKVQEYANSIEEGGFPPILLNQDNILLDGWHRWKAYLEKKLETIDVEYLNTSEFVFDGKADLFAIKRKAARSNFRHGHPQTEKELKKLIRDEYRAKLDTLDQKGRAELKREMAEDYSRSERHVREMTSRIDKDLKAELRETAFNMWMGCYSQQEIADEVGYGQPAIAEFTNLLQSIKNGTGAENDNLSENPQLTEMEFDEEKEDNSNSLGVYKIDKRLMIKATHMDEYFKPPIYNIWKQQTKTEGITHFGNSEITFLDNLLYFYTKPFDVVIDPFAGSGSTIDLCKARMRRYLVSDRKPVDIRDDIREYDINVGVISPPIWKDVGLVYLDPPYWKQAEGEYSDDPTDLANMTLEDFNKKLSSVIKKYAEKIKRARSMAYIALIIQPTQWKADNKQFTDHVGDMLSAVNLPVNMRYSVPYESQQYTPQMVNWAKENKTCLVLTREIIVWEVK